MSRLIYASLVLLGLMGTVVRAELPVRTVSAIEAQMTAVEDEAAQILRVHFSESLEVRYLLQSFDESKEESKEDRHVFFMVFWVFVETELKPKLKDPTAQQKAAIERFDLLRAQHSDLEVELEKARTGTLSP